MGIRWEGAVGRVSSLLWTCWVVWCGVRWKDGVKVRDLGIRYGGVVEKERAANLTRLVRGGRLMLELFRDSEMDDGKAVKIGGL